MVKLVQRYSLYLFVSILTGFISTFLMVDYKTIVGISLRLTVIGLSVVLSVITIYKTAVKFRLYSYFSDDTVKQELDIKYTNYMLYLLIFITVVLILMYYLER